MSSETELLDNLISSHKKKLEEIRQWQVSYPKQCSQLSTNDQYGNHNLNDQPYLNNQTSVDIPQLAKKVTRQKGKIKTLKASLNLLSEENASLKNELIRRENYTQSLTIDHKKNQYDHTDLIEREQSLLAEITRLQETICSLENKIDKMVRLDCIKTQDIELLNQKVKDLEIITEENAQNASYDINKLTKDNEVYRNQLNEVDKLFELFNYFSKRMSAMYPNEITGEQISYLNVKEYQNKLIQIENCIVNDKNKMTFELKGLDDTHYQKLMLLNKKIDQLTNENQALEEKINEEISAKANATASAKKKTKKENRSTSSNVKKAKKTPRALSKPKIKK